MSLYIGSAARKPSSKADDSHQRHSWPTLSSACARPLSENTSAVAVPRADVPLMVRSVPLRMESTRRVSSAAFLTQAPSAWVYMEYVAPPISSVASELGLKP